MVWHRRHGSAVDHGALYRASGWLVDFVRHALVTGTEPTPHQPQIKKKPWDRFRLRPLHIYLACRALQLRRAGSSHESLGINIKPETAGVTATCILVAMAKMVMEHRLLQRSERGKWCAFWFPIAALVGLNPEMGESSSSWRGRKPSTSCNGWPT